MSKYTPHTPSEIKEMLTAVGCKSFSDLYSNVPETLLYPEINIEEGITEGDAERKLTHLASKNRIYNSIFLGAGAYKHYIPAPVRN